MKIPTVRIMGSKGGIIINEKDFDPDKHELFKEPKKVEKTVPTAPKKKVEPPPEKKVEPPPEKKVEPEIKKSAVKKPVRRRKR